MEKMNIKELREQTGLTVREFADKLIISEESVRRYEKGRQPKPVIAHFIKCIFPAHFSLQEISEAGNALRNAHKELEIEIQNWKGTAEELAGIINHFDGQALSPKN